jgi:hypothetical protein
MIQLRSPGTLVNAGEGNVAYIVAEEKGAGRGGRNWKAIQLACNVVSQYSYKRSPSV